MEECSFEEDVEFEEVDAELCVGVVWGEARAMRVRVEGEGVRCKEEGGSPFESEVEPRVEGEGLAAGLSGCQDFAAFG